MSDDRVKVHVWYVDGTEETFYADVPYQQSDGFLYWTMGDKTLSIPDSAIKKVEEN